MKKIGIIGGAGPLASALLYETLVHESYSRAMNPPEIYLINYPFSRGLTIIEKDCNERKILEEMRFCVKMLQRINVDIGVLACNTLHLILKQIDDYSIQFPFLPAMVVNDAKINNHSQLLILGTQCTCRSELYSLQGSETAYPSQSDQKCLDMIIDRILNGKIIQDDSKQISEIIQRHSKVEGVVLACTDFSVLHHKYPIQTGKPIYDSIKIASKTLVGML